MESNLNSFFNSILSSVSASNNNSNIRSSTRLISENQNMDTNISSDELKRLCAKLNKNRQVLETKCRDLQNNNISLRADRNFLIEIINRVFEVNFDADEEMSKPDIRNITDEWKLKVTEIVSSLENEIVELKKKLKDNHRNESTLPSNLGNLNNNCESCLKIQEEVLKENEFLRVKLSESQQKLSNHDNIIKVESNQLSTQNDLSLLKDRQVQLEVNLQSALSKNAELENSVNTLKEDFVALKNTNYEQTVTMQQLKQAIEDLKLNVKEKERFVCTDQQQSTLFNFNQPSSTTTTGMAIFSSDVKTNSSEFLTPEKSAFALNIAPAINLELSSFGTPITSNSSSTFISPVPFNLHVPNTPTMENSTSATTSSTKSAPQLLNSSESSNIFNFSTSTFTMSAPQPPISSTAPSVFGKTATATPAASTVSAQQPISSSSSSLYGTSSTMSVPFMFAHTGPVSTIFGTIPNVTAIPAPSSTTSSENRYAIPTTNTHVPTATAYVTDNARIIPTVYSQTSPTSITVTSPVATNSYGITRAGTICKNCLRKGSRCWQHPL